MSENRATRKSNDVMVPNFSGCSHIVGDHEIVFSGHEKFKQVRQCVLINCEEVAQYGVRQTKALALADFITRLVKAISFSFQH